MIPLGAHESAARIPQASEPQAKKASEPQAKPSEPSASEDYGTLQAVIETERGDIVMEFFPRDAPHHVAYFVQLARQGFYDGTTFHRLLKDALIQGGDPLSRNPRTPRLRLGTGGLDKLKPEFNDRIFVRGTVGAVLRPKVPDSAGSQFFICVTDQMQLTGQYTAFGRVVRGIDVVEAISAVPTEENDLAKERVVIKSVAIRPALPSTEELKRSGVTVQTDLGPFTIELLPEAAPKHVKYFLDLAGSGFYDGTTFHIIMPGYLLQGGDPMTRGSDRQYWGRGWSGDWLPAEFNQTPFERGTVGTMLLRPDDPNSGTCQFFICLARAPHLDGKYTAWGKVVDGLEVLDQIAKLKTDEKKAPVEPVILRKFKVIRVAPNQPAHNQQ
jgi:cyclophilin family peptidyl-prolyl cis-trans isomerase